LAFEPLQLEGASFSKAPRNIDSHTLGLSPQSITGLQGTLLLFAEAPFGSSSFLEPPLLSPPPLFEPPLLSPPLGFGVACPVKHLESYLPFDFCIPEYKIIIELDGPQHFQQISNWSSPEEQFENDKYKETCANDNSYSVIRLLQEDVFYDTYDWVKELCETIEEIKNGDEVVNVYLCKNGEYDAF
jgi:hypothetical protein